MIVRNDGSFSLKRSCRSACCHNDPVNEPMRGNINVWIRLLRHCIASGKQDSVFKESKRSNVELEQSEINVSRMIRTARYLQNEHENREILSFLLVSGVFLSDSGSI
ncbi:MAG: hypothetical protein J6D36_04785 [Erysipelotrichaceae bacterium]|nr:hypothetical protein [Erysipelotrichaceae bacterium]